MFHEFMLPCHVDQAREASDLRAQLAQRDQAITALRGKACTQILNCIELLYQYVRPTLLSRFWRARDNCRCCFDTVNIRVRVLL